MSGSYHDWFNIKGWQSPMISTIVIGGLGRRNVYSIIKADKVNAIQGTIVYRNFETVER